MGSIEKIMLMPKANRVAIYEQLFMVAKKDFHLAKHPDVPVPNLHVIKACQSLKSRGLVNEQFAWRHYYWYLSNEGIQYLRDFLHLPPEIVPATLKRQQRAEAARPRPKMPEGGPRTPMGEGRQAYRRGGENAPDKKADAGAGATENFQFRAGYGRGRGSAPQ